MKPSPCATRRRRGFLLLPVAILLCLVAAAAYLLSVQGAVALDSTARARQAKEALYVAQAGLAHASFAAHDAGCTGYGLPAQPFGAHAYSAVASPALGSPVRITATATLASGLTRSISRDDVTVYQGRGTTASLPAIADTYLYEFHPTFNNGTDTGFDAGEWGGAGTRFTALVQFDLASIPAEATVVSAALDLYSVSPGYYGGPLSVRRVDAPWVDVEANWTLKQSLDPWSTPGGDYGSAPYAVLDVPAGVGWNQWDVTALVEEWVTNASPNHGLALVGEAPNAQARFASIDSSDTTLHPRLEVTYVCECGASPTQFTLQLVPGIAGEDTYIDDGSTANFGDETEVRLSNKSNSQKRALLRFDLSDVPPQAIVTSAELELNLEGIGSGNSGTVEIFRVLEDWVEGTGVSAACPDGATWLENDGACGAWANAGGSFDSVIEASAPIDVVALGPVTWDVGALVGGWVDGTFPNFGMMLIPSLDINHADFSTGDDSDASLHPKLTVTYACPCGVVCEPPVSFGDQLAMVVVDPASLTTQEAAKRDLLEDWEFNVSLIDVDADQATFDAANDANDAFFVTEDITASDLGDKLNAASIGIVTEEDNLSDQLGLSTSIAWQSGTGVDLVDTTHYITESFASGPLTLFTASESLAELTGTLAPDLSVLGSGAGGGLPMLVALEQGGERHDGWGASEGRRVQLPWGGSNFDLANLNADGRTLFQRAIEWAATPPPPHPGYLDRFESPLCDPLVDYTRSHGALDWSGSAWIDALDGDPCSGLAQIKVRFNGFRLQLDGDGSMERAVDLSGFSFALLRYRHRLETDVGATRYLLVEVSDDGGGSWTEVDRIDEPGDGTFQPASVDITALATAATVIRFSAVNLLTAAFLDDIAVVEEETVNLCGTGTYLDQFQANHYGGSDGSFAWATDWLEINESDGPTKQDEQVTSFDGELRLRVRDNDGGGEGVEREADLSMAATATLSFVYRRDGWDDPDDFVSIEASADGGATWGPLGTIVGPGSDASFQDASYPLDAYLAPNTRIRLLSSPDLGMHDSLYIDDVQICLD